MIARRLILACALVCLLAVPAAADLVPIHLDGFFDDWAAVTPVHDDSNDNSGTVDFGRIWVANDQDFLFIRCETGGEVQPVSSSPLPCSGSPSSGCGSEYSGASTGRCSVTPQLICRIFVSWRRSVGRGY